MEGFLVVYERDAERDIILGTSPSIGLRHGCGLSLRIHYRIQRLVVVFVSKRVVRSKQFVFIQ